MNLCLGEKWSSSHENVTGRILVKLCLDGKNETLDIYVLFSFGVFVHSYIHIFNTNIIDNGVYFWELNVKV